MESILLFILAILIIFSSFIYFSMSDAFSTECPKHKKVKKFVKKHKYVKKDYEEHISKINAFNKTSTNPLPSKSIIQCNSNLDMNDKRLKKNLVSVEERMYNQNIKNVYDTRPVFL